MNNVLHRYDKCLICNSDLIVKYYDGHYLSGSLNRIGDSYLLTYNNKSKIHKVVFDLNFKIIKNDGYPYSFFLVKHCDKCNPPDFIEPPYFAIKNIKSPAMFYMFHLNNRRKEKIVLLEELIRFRAENISYGTHSKFNAKTKVWHSTVMIADTTKSIDDVFIKTMETNNYNAFSSLEEVIDKLSVYHTFS